MSSQTANAARTTTGKTVLLFLLLFFTTLQLPSWHVMDGLHDPGGVAALEYWTQHAYQYGTQIIVNVGPLGFISNPKLYTGFLDAEKLLLGILCTSLYVMLIIHFAKMISDKACRILLYLNVIFFSSIWVENSYGNADIRLYLLMLMAAYVIFEGNKRNAALLLSPVIALLSLAKGTFLIVALIILIFATLQHLLRRNYRFVAALLGLYLTSVLLFWLTLGQKLETLPSFLGNMLDFRNGYAAAYTEAMLLFEAPHMTILGFSTLALAGLAILLRNFSGFRSMLHADKCKRTGIALLEGFILFVVWKHGFTRADGHMATYFYFLQIAAIFFLLLPSTGEGNARARKLSMPLMLCCLTGTVMCTLHLKYAEKADLRHEAMRNLYVMLYPAQYVRNLTTGLNESKEAMQLPHTQQLVKQESIGYFGYLPAPMLYNNFNYATMPNTMSFAGWTHVSMLNDAAFYANPATAPSYLLYSQGTFDNRISAQDDALAQLEILSRYDPVLDKPIIAETAKRILLKRRDSAQSIKHLNVPIREARRRIGEWVDTPQAEEPLRVSIHLHRKPIEEIVKTFYKSSEYRIELKLNNGTSTSRKFIPRMAEDGFLIAPFIDTNQQFALAYSNTEYAKYLAGESALLNRVTSLRIYCINLLIACADDFTVSFETLEGLDLGRLHMKPQFIEAFTNKPNLE